MSGPAGLHVVLGAGGGTGRTLVNELLDRGRPVRAVIRSPGPDLPAGAEQVRADLTDEAATRRATAGAAVVFHAAQPAYHRWPQEFPELTATIRRATAAAGGRLVVMDNLYLHGPHDGPLREDLPSSATGRKGRVRAEMARSLLQAHAASELPVVLGRGSTSRTPGATSPASRALVTLADEPSAYGRAWHLPAAPALTGRELLEMLFAAAGTRPRYGNLPVPLVHALGLVDPVVRELPRILPEFTRPYVLDAGAYQERFGPFVPTAHEQAVPDTVAWFRAR